MANLLFASGFEAGVSLASPRDIHADEAWQDLVGTDSVTGYTWPTQLWGGTSSIQLLTEGGNLNDVIRNTIETTTGHNGTPTQALHLNVLQKVNDTTQDPLLILPPASQAPQDFYISEWIKFPADMAQRLGPKGWITGMPDYKSSGDFRPVTAIQIGSDGIARFNMTWDNDANKYPTPLPYQSFWSSTSNVAVPLGEWMHVEFSTHRGQTDGRVVEKVNGTTIFDHTGDTIGVDNDQINRIFLANAYSNKPMDMWLDDVQVWDGTPTGTTAPATPPSGTDTLIVAIAEDAWNGDAQYTISVDGHLVGGTRVATASHAAGASENVSLAGNWGAGAHTIGIAFINDAYGGTSATDRNLYVNSVTYDGKAASGAPATLLSNGAVNFTTAAAGPTTTINLHLAEDAWNGDAQYSLTLDGKAFGPNGTVTASNAQGQSQAVALQAAVAAGTHDLGVTFLNDSYGGTPTTDRNLYVKGFDVNGTPVPGAAATLLSNGTVHFQFVTSAT